MVSGGQPEEKIKFLEQLPSIEVFVGLDAVRASATEVPELPVRARLQAWLQEHDKIEKETEVFDSGSLRSSRNLPKEAAQFASRTSSLQHTKIALAGKALDKLIDNSRKPVPDELLDEQDKLENEGITEMEEIGNFVMQMVVQWKKTDEYYVKILKDKSDAQTLLEEIEVAKLGHPTPRQDASFMSRTGVLNKRLLLRGHPACSPMFPKPEHHHFVQQLSSEMASALQQVRKVKQCAKKYHASLEAVKQVEAVCKSASELSSRFQSITDRLENGIAASNGDGTPPDLSTKMCLDSTAHSVFLSLFSSVIQELQKATDEAGPLLSSARAALLHLDFPEVDSQFTSDSIATIDALESTRAAAVQAKDSVASRITTLNKIRKVWSAVDGLFHETDDVRNEIIDAMSRQMWRQQVRHDAPPTPESPTTSLPAVSISPEEVLHRLALLRGRVAQDVSSPLSALNISLSPALRTYLINFSSSLEAFPEHHVRCCKVLGSGSTLSDHDDSCPGRGSVVPAWHRDLKVRYDQAAQVVFAGVVNEDAISEMEGTLSADLATSRSKIQAFLDELPRRIPLVDEVKLVGATERSTRQLQGVRTDSNTYNMMLSGALKTLDSKADYFQLAKKAHAVDVALASLTDRLIQATDAVASIQTGEERLSSERLEELSMSLEQVAETREASIQRAHFPVQKALHLVPPRLRKSIVSLKQHVIDAQKAELNRLAEETRLREEQERLEAEAESLRAREAAASAEAERLEGLERARVEREEAEAEERERRERERAAAEERERLERLERERAEAEERERREKAEAEERARQEKEEAESSFTLVIFLPDLLLMADDSSKHGESTLKDALQRAVRDNDVHDEGKDEIAASTQGDERAKGGDWEEVKAPILWALWSHARTSDLSQGPKHAIMPIFIHCHQLRASADSYSLTIRYLLREYGYKETKVFIPKAERMEECMADAG
ncbi:hypothetical protein L226DRAFT_568996 [Lentinus tigrinus ALCF2SS1-7]|uniref:uncharacterized protein n=1 Tax=Lentinus tigrinus ALCF2SS1-7 TaxID=1328758 RepID=UPI00116639E5|nr:hypothetical protein L226DRAFT_568996 [Lentinus tigrinus ALCF2SS1-7]